MMIFVGFYTGEFTRALTDEMVGMSGVWYDTVDKMTFGDGYAVGWMTRDGGDGDAREADAYDEAWGVHLSNRIAQGPYTYTMTTKLLDFQTGVFIHGDANQMVVLARKFASTLQKDLTSLGGDDSIFDYYPDAIEALYQLCVGITDRPKAARSIYEQTAQNAWDELYHDIGEYSSIDACFPAWPKPAVEKPA